MELGIDFSLVLSTFMRLMLHISHGHPCHDAPGCWVGFVVQCQVRLLISRTQDLGRCMARQYVNVKLITLSATATSSPRVYQDGLADGPAWLGLLFVAAVPELSKYRDMAVNRE